MNNNDNKRVRGFEIIEGSNGIMPTRKTKYSAGYDLYLPVNVNIPPNCIVTVPLKIKAYMQNDEVLMIHIRSSLSLHGIMLQNSVGVIDSDYYNNKENGGNISLLLYNTGNTPFMVNKGTRVAQGVFVKYLVADTGNTDSERIGGLGSTGVCNV